MFPVCPFNMSRIRVGIPGILGVLTSTTEMKNFPSGVFSRSTKERKVAKKGTKPTNFDLRETSSGGGPLKNRPEDPPECW